MNIHDLKFIPYEFPTSANGQFIIGQEDYQVLRSRRMQLGLSQQQVADAAQIQLKQYQRIETGNRHISGCSMRVGLAVCAALLLDPLDFLDIDIRQPDPAKIEPQNVSNINLRRIPQNHIITKNQRQEDMICYIFAYGAELSIPAATLDAFGKPRFIGMYDLLNDGYIILRSVDSMSSMSLVLDIPDEVYSSRYNLVIANDYLRDRFQQLLHLNPKQIYQANCFLDQYTFVPGCPAEQGLCIKMRTVAPIPKGTALGGGMECGWQQKVEIALDDLETDENVEDDDE